MYTAFLALLACLVFICVSLYGVPSSLGLTGFVAATLLGMAIDHVRARGKD